MLWAFAATSWRALRFNFRGVGRSAGTHDAGEAETDDLLALADAIREVGLRHDERFVSLTHSAATRAP